jgi:hypothetical protein
MIKLLWIKGAVNAVWKIMSAVNQQGLALDWFPIPADQFVL